ncbi:type II toxin-antitoxin system RelE/ParE family toxin [Streptomyces gobiensis]|uniref:type II toxin-antitoxin system RelE/ParE family toxin n=1 Tax=Streptomyces gobiensis TaxID=2875706 RepID=UPI001E3DB581|nr:type II toxin-antitoxin system RelE/ParE family toxin [Streptomyces gobiensis]UGY93538.1 type II toxin-antitoxin system RelE/ParE family toxin [Streptomyces gobiensis]
MTDRWEIELEPDVAEWLGTLPRTLYRTAERQADHLAAQPTTLGEPFSRHLGGSLRELRFVLGTDTVRIPYWLAPDRRIVLLTVFHDTRMREEAQLQQAVRKQKECESEHPPAHETYHRTFEEQP